MEPFFSGGNTKAVKGRAAWTSEYFKADVGQFKASLELPNKLGRSGSCVSRLNYTSFAITGGNTLSKEFPNKIQNVDVLNIDSMSWSKIPHMPTRRADHTCGIINGNDNFNNFQFLCTWGYKYKY